MLFFPRKQIFVLSILAIAAPGFVLCGCRSGFEEQSAQDQRVVATINNYRMTVSDFKERVNLVLASKYLSTEPNEAKEELLDELLTKNVLLQEAQRQNLDKERPFMKEIERYWEQSLLKVLLKKKSEELSRHIYVEDSEVINEYMRMKRRIFAQLTILNDREAAEKLSAASADNFDKIRESLKEKIISGELPQWWVLGDLPRYLEAPLFSLKAGETTLPVKCGNNWAVIKIISEEKLEIEPFKNMAMAIKKSIRKRKEEEAFEVWIENLRKDVPIKINKKVLSEIDLK